MAQPARRAVSVSGVICDEHGRVLLIRRRDNQHWEPPGGVLEFDETLTDLHIPWADMLRTLSEGGYRGWLSSEYEGRREPYRGREQVRRQHALLRSLA